MAQAHTLPSLPAKHEEFVQWVQKHQDTAVEQLVAPYNSYEAVVRKLFAQEPSNPILHNNYLNIVPVYGADGCAIVQTRARDPSTESPEHLEKYIMPLKDEDRRPSGSPAIVPNLEEFKNNFNIFSEGSLTDLDWSNVVVAGSAAVTCLLPVPEAHRGSKRALRQYYHEKVAPASDVDLFLYGLTEEQAIKKIKHIENSVKNAILHETTTFRTKNAITIVSQYPTRHVQIVLRIYKSVAEILTGFDVDCSCAAFDGKQVYASPRALASYITQKNTIDLSRRSPSYENRLSKYSRRGFEIYWPQLDRSKIDPTIFERGFSRTVGLARLLVLEQLPTPSNRDSYMRQRREERGRPRKPGWMIYGGRGNYKEDWEDEVPEWLDEPEESNYNTFTIPYGKKYYARKIEKLFFNQDLLLNAEWNKPKDREVYLHRHPAFFGDVKDVIHDCCGYCPKPVTDEEKQVAEKESKTYVSGKISFIKDDPGRQEVGSFNPITETDWTEMAYVGNTERLCQAIVDHDLEVVKEWLSQESADPNTRDYTGRTPLHLACMASTPEIVQCLVDHGARLTARLADGRTALHIAAARGITKIVTILLNRSEFNEAEEDCKNDMRKAQSKENKQSAADEVENDPDEMDIDSSPDDATSYTAGSFVKIGKGNDANATDQDVLDSDSTDEPDIYDINVVAWDSHASALHLAILNGHVDVVQELVGSWGADVLLPIKLLQEYDKSPRASILTLVLALRLPLDKAIDMSRKLLQLGASPTQADVARQTPLQYIAASSYSELLDVYIQQNQPATLKAINRLKPTGSGWSRPAVTSPLLTAIEHTNIIGALKLLEHGADVDLDFSNFVNAIKNAYERQARTTETNKEIFRHDLSQPIICAVDSEMPELVLELLKRGADPNTLNCAGYAAEDRRSGRASDGAMSVLDCVRSKIKQIDEYERPKVQSPPILEVDKNYFEGLEEGSYRRWYAQRKLQDARDAHEKSLKNLEDQNKRQEKELKGEEMKVRVLADIRRGFEEVEAALLERGAKTWKDLFPQFYEDDGQQDSRGSSLHDHKAPPLMPKFTFILPDLTDVRQEGVLKLFDAAWRGDLETIKQLTLGRWGVDGKQTPLEVAIQDDCDLSPFSIAVFRGHLDTAKGIMEIVRSQYKKPEPKGHAQYEMTDNYSEEESNIEDPELEPYHIYGTVVDEEFTTDDIGSAPAHVESSVAPLTVLTWCCPGKWFLDMSKRGSSEPYTLLQHAVLSDDIPALSFLLDLGHSLTAQYKPEDLYMINYGEFELALQHGRVRCLEELILRTGSCLPLDYFIQSSGAAKDEKPKYYQGLSIRGKRRADWAAAAFSGSATDVSLPDAPLLSAARSGNLTSTEWFLGTAPARNYVEFMKNHGDYKQIELLARCKGGVEKPLLSWLKQANYLVLHCAIISKPNDESERLVEYLCHNMPECLEKKTQEGYTPLALAFSMHRVAFARILVKAGANQAVRDGDGNNLLHLLLCGIECETRGDPENVETLLGLFDSRLVGSLLVERSVGSLTPISRWLQRATLGYGYACYYYGSSSERFNYGKESEELVEVTRRLLEFAKPTGQKHLEVLDGAGNSPVHDAVRRQLPRVLELMVDQRPDLLLRENATGSTPMELAVEAWVEEVTYEPVEIKPQFRGFTGRRGEEFLEDQKTPKRSERKIIYDLCREVAAQRPGKRKLVTLNEAHEVAKRLAAAEKGKKPEIQDTDSKNPEDCIRRWYDAYRGFSSMRVW